MRSRISVAVAAAVWCGLALQGGAQSAYYFYTAFGTHFEVPRDGAGAEAVFVDARGVVIAADGTAYVADAGAHSIRRVSTARVTTTFAGVSGSPGNEDGTGAAARFNTPTGLALDAAGNLYVADSGNNRVRRITPAAEVTTIAGAAAGVLSAPQAVAVDDRDGSVIVANTGRHTIERVASDGTVTSIAGSSGVQGSADGVGSAARFSGPAGVAVDAAGTIYVSDTQNNTIRRITTGGIVSTWLGAVGDPGPDVDPSTQTEVKGTLDGDSATARFALPQELFFDRETATLLVKSNTWTRVQRGGFVPTFAPDRLRAASAAGLVSTLTSGGPSMFGPAARGGVTLVAERRRIFRLGQGGARVEYAGRGDGCDPATPLDGPRLEARFCSVTSVAVAPADVYVADSNCTIRRAAPDGTVTTVAGSRDATGTADGVGAAARFCGGAVFGSPVLMIDVGPDGVIYVADILAHTIRAVRPDGTTRTVAGLGGVDGVDDGTGSQARFTAPFDLAVDHAGIIYVADTGNSTIRRITPDGVVTTIAGVARAGGSTDGFRSAARFSSPWGIAVGPDGIVYIADTGNHTIRRMTPDGIVSTFAGVAGSAGTVDGAGAAARFNAPKSIAVDHQGNVYVGSNSGTIRRISPDGTVTSILHFFSCGPGCTDGYGTVTDADAAGNIYIPFRSTVVVGTTASGPAAAPVITTQPASQTVDAGRAATFTAAASGSPAPTFRWQGSSDGGATWADLPEGLAYEGTLTATLRVRDPIAATPALRVRAVAGNVFGATASSPAVLNVRGLIPRPSLLRFRVTNANAGAIGPHPSQQVYVDFVGVPVVPLTWTANLPWVTVTPVPGAPAASVRINGAELGNSTHGTAIITVRAPSLDVLATITVLLEVNLDPATSAAPVGQVDTPAQNATGVQGAISFSGWATDDIGVEHVRVYRNCLAEEPQANCQSGVIPGQPATAVVFVGQAHIVPGARPDIDAAFPSNPSGNRAGWGYLMLTNMLPRTTGTFATHGGQGPVTLYAVATDFEGRRTLLGRNWAGDTTPTAITLDNDAIARPFGALDTPEQGQTVQGTLNVFGWALAPDTNAVAGDGDILIPTAGSVTVFVDGAPVGLATYNQCRGSVGNPVPAGVFCNDDVANIFGNATPQAALTARSSNPTKFRNLDAARGAIAAYQIDTTQLANGQHTIALSVTDSANRTEGIGSRFFTVLNGAARAAGDELVARRAAPVADAAILEAYPRADRTVRGRTGFDLRAPLRDVSSASGAAAVVLHTGGRLELDLGGPVGDAYLVSNGLLRELPAGSRLDAPAGVFTWAPAPGYLGNYRLVFLAGGGQLPVDVAIVDAPPSGGQAQIRMGLDTPALNDRSLRVEGWALDPHAWTGSGIETVHIWAWRRDAPALPQFLGAATLGQERPDAAAAHGVAGRRSGFALSATGFPAGDYDVVAYAWCTRTGRWEDARVVRVTIR